MRKTRPWLYLFLPLLYLGVVFGLVVLQFSKKSDSFSQSLGDMTVAGKIADGGGPSDLSLRGRGFEFKFTAAHTLGLVRSDGSVVGLRPVQWAWKDGNLIVQFEKGVVLTLLKTSAGGSVLLLQPTLPADLAKTTVKLHLPFAPEGGGRSEVNATRPLVVVTKGSQRFLASLDGLADVVENDNSFLLGVSQGLVRPIRLEPLPEGADPVRQWLAQASNDTATAQAKEAQAAWVDRAWKGWSEGRLSAARGGWVTSDGNVRFSSRLAAAWAREGLARGTYPAVMATIQGLPGLSAAKWGNEALPYLGNLMEVTQAHRRSVEAALANVDWTDAPNLWRQAVFYGPAGAPARLERLMLSGELPTKTAALLGLFENLVAVKVDRGTEIDPAVEPRLAQVIAELIGRTVRQDDELFVLTGEGWRDLKSSLLLGKLLQGQTSNLEAEQWQSIGSQLILSVLRYQDSFGGLPEAVLARPGQAVKREGLFYPEEVPQLLPTKEPVEIRLEGVGENAFVRSANPLVSKVSTPAQLKLRFQFPVGSAESIVVSGIGPFESILLHAIRWRTDPQFQGYTDGWYYSAATRTLYVKIKHREELEELVINWAAQ